MRFRVHIPVLLNEAIEQLNLSDGKKVIDATAGLGGHSRAILEKIYPNGKLLAIDTDSENLDTSKENLKKYKSRAIFVHSNFENLKKESEKCSFGKADAILFDLGLCSQQINSQKRGFSFQTNGPLDMRFDQSRGCTAEEIINRFRKENLIRIFKEYGQVRRPSQIASAIIRKRKKTHLRTTFDLRDAVREVTRSIKETARVFQSIRIETNNELKSLEKALHEAVSLLKKNGRIAVISYHSLEDRLAKNTFRYYTKNCICALPVCRCRLSPCLQIITKHPIRSSQKEIINNPRSRSAKLRSARKI